MTATTQALSARLKHEAVRRVTARALHAFMKRPISRRFLMAVAAGAGGALALFTSRVRVMAADALADLGGLRVIWMHAAVAAHTGSLNIALHGVRLVARRTLLVLLNLLATEQIQIRMARLTLDSALLLKRVRLMATDAGPMPCLEERARGHQRLLLGVAVDAGP